MSVRRITISVSNELARKIKKVAGPKPVSAWVADVIEEHLNDAKLERQWRRYCADVNLARQDKGAIQAPAKALV